MVPFSAGYGAFLFVYALIAQGHFGFDGLTSGAVLALFAVAFFVVTLYTPRIAAALGARIVTLGALAQGTGLLLALVIWLGWPHPSLVLVLVGIAFTGVGAALIGPTLFRTILADVPPAQAGMGSGVLATSQQTATALGATVGGTLYVSLAGWLPGVGGRTRSRPAGMLLGDRSRDQPEAPRPQVTPGPLERRDLIRTFWRAGARGTACSQRVQRCPAAAAPMHWGGRRRAALRYGWSGHASPGRWPAWSRPGSTAVAGRACGGSRRSRCRKGAGPGGRCRRAR
jgi:MFS family permease